MISTSNISLIVLHEVENVENFKLLLNTVKFVFESLNLEQVRLITQANTYLLRNGVFQEYEEM